MGKTFKFDPDDDFGTGLSKKDRKRLRQERKDRLKREKMLDSHLTADDGDEGDPILTEVLKGDWDKF